MHVFLYAQITVINRAVTQHPHTPTCVRSVHLAQIHNYNLRVHLLTHALKLANKLSTRTV